MYIFKCLGNVNIADYPLNSIKGKIFTQTYIEEFVDDDSNDLDFNLKPKFILFSFGKTIIHHYFLHLNAPN